MATNKSFAERIKLQKEIMEKAELKIKELEEAERKEEAEKKQKKVDSILRDVEKALGQSPIITLSKGSEEYKRFLNMIRLGEVKIEISEEKNGKINTSIYDCIGRIIEAEIGRKLRDGDEDRFRIFIEKQDSRGNYFRNVFSEVQ